MPRPGLLELRRIAMGFDHLAERLQRTLDTQRQLAQRLISSREEERRHLARELHDEFGQCLTSIAAEAAFIAACTSVVAHMMASLQNILGQLWPRGLEEFGPRRTVARPTGSSGSPKAITALPGGLLNSLLRPEATTTYSHAETVVPSPSRSPHRPSPGAP